MNGQISWYGGLSVLRMKGDAFMGNMEKMIRRLQNGNDVRGAAIAAGKEERTLTPGIVSVIAHGFEKWLAEETGKNASDLRIGIGHDSRLTGEELKNASFRGLLHAQLYDCGLISTPAMFQSTLLPASDFDGAVMLTASHLPFNRNGMKFFTKKGSPSHDEMTAILDRACEVAGKYGEEDKEELIRIRQMPESENKPVCIDMTGIYSGHMKELIRKEVNSADYDHPLAGLHIVVDAGNGAAGFFATDILSPLGADISGSICLEPDGTFPVHIPNPENPDAMAAVSAAVRDAAADLGVIFDCDGDRGAVVFADGTPVNRNSLIALLGVIVSETAPGSTIVTDSVTSDELAVFLENLGLRHFRYRRGYKNVIDKGIELNEEGQRCELAIETSGHGAFKENHFSDDGAYIAVKIICRMARLAAEGRRIESLIEDLKVPAESIEVRFAIKDEDFRKTGEQALADLKPYVGTIPGAGIVEPNYEGIRVAFSGEEVKGWLLLRMSLHDPQLAMNVEADRPGGTDLILSYMEPFFSAHPGIVRS